jgi:putative copper export protein
MLYVTALIIHVLSIVIWIGGVAFVTMITFPMIVRVDNSLEQVMMFQGTEHRFSKIAKFMVILAGLSGLYLIFEKGLSFGVWVMIIIWTFYAALLFGLEKIIFKKLFSNPEGRQTDTKKVFKLLQGFHWFVLALSFLAIAAGIYEAHY